MTQRFRRGLLLTTLCVLGFAAGCSRGAESAPKSSAEPSRDEAPAGASAPVSSEASPEAPPPAPAVAGPAAAAAPKQEPKEAPALEESSDSQAKKKSSATETELSRLTATRGLFDEAMKPERLSCDGARPLRDAICEIAERLCDLSAKSPSSTNSTEDCTTAKSGCEQAQRKYKERCGK